MIKLNILEKHILKSLLKSYGSLDSYTLFKRMKVSVSELSNALTYLTSHEYVTDDDHVIKITEKGTNNVYFNPNESSKEDRKWREMPVELKLESLGVNEPYIPSVRILDKKTFNFNENEVV